MHKISDWVRGMPKISAGTAKEWREWEMVAKRKKVRYCLAEDGLDVLQGILNWPRDRWSDVRHYIDNRWIAKTHALTSGLKQGKWHDFDTRLLHSTFDSLVDFVEVELACFNIACSDEVRNKYKDPWYHTVWPFRACRKPLAGMDYLDWAASLKHDEDWMDPNDLNFGKPTAQAIAAQETIVLYKWWKQERPLRPDPMDASGWSAYCDEKREKNSSWIDWNEEAEEDKVRSRRILEICHQMEQEQENEDTEMLIRLIKVRQYLWT